jgi:hypothetical protein
MTFVRTKSPYLVAAMLLFPWVSAAAQGPTIVGWIEPIQLDTGGVRLTAKLDTGADVSSLHVSNLKRITREDGEWVVFDVVGADQRRVTLERKVKRVARVRNAAGVQERPTILLGICLGDIYRTSEVNLTDRSHLNVPFLVGRSFLAERFAVDSSRTHTVQPACTGAASAEAPAAPELS